MSKSIHQTDEPITLQTYDLESGEKLLLEYFPEEDLITINGYPASRAQGDVGSDNEILFLRRIDKKLFTIDALLLSRLFN